MTINFRDTKTGNHLGSLGETSTEITNAIALHRFAFGFRIADLGVTPWPDHPGYHTEEGQGLNESAREVGDDPDDWYVSEKPIDLLLMAEIWLSKSKYKPKLERNAGYLADVRHMVTLYRTTPGVYIPPSWLTEEQGQALARSCGVPCLSMARYK
jgi:hypothetical protein